MKNTSCSFSDILLKVGIVTEDGGFVCENCVGLLRKVLVSGVDSGEAKQFLANKKGMIMV
jgi:hypothetical protein